MFQFFRHRIVVCLLLTLISCGQIFAENLDSQLDAIAKQQTDIVLGARYRNYTLPSTIQNRIQASKVLIWLRSLQTSTQHLNHALGCNLTTRNVLDVLTTYKEMTTFIQDVVGGGIEIDVQGFVRSCQLFNTCYVGDMAYSDTSYRSCKDIVTLYYNQAFALHASLYAMEYGILGEGNFIDAETNNTPGSFYDLLKLQEDNALALDSTIHPATNSMLYPNLSDIQKHESYNQLDPSFPGPGSSHSEETPAGNMPGGGDEAFNLGYQSQDHMDQSLIRDPVMILQGLKLAQSTMTLGDSQTSLGPSSQDPAIQSDMMTILHNNSIPAVSGYTSVLPPDILLCETGIQIEEITDADTLSGFVYLANIRQDVVNASIEAQYALEQVGLNAVVDGILQEQYPDKIINDTTLYEVVYGYLPDINQPRAHKDVFGQDIDPRPSFDAPSKQEQIASLAQQSLNTKTSDLGGGANAYEQDAATCKQTFSLEFDQCQVLGEFKKTKVCIEKSLFDLKKCVKQSLCTNLFSVGDYLGATICRVSKGLDQVTSKTQVSSLLEITNSIKGPLTFLKNSGKILPHKVKREFLETTLKFKLSDLFSFQIRHGSKLIWQLGDHKQKAKEQEDKNQEQFRLITQSVVQKPLADKDKYSQSYTDTQSLSQTPGSTAQIMQYSMMLGRDIQSKLQIRSHDEIVSDFKVKHRSDILRIYSDHRDKTAKMRNHIADAVSRQKDIAKAASDADQKS